MTLVIIYCILSVIIVSAILIKLKWNDKCTIGDLLWGLFLVVLSPASLIVIIIVELVESGFFKKSLSIMELEKGTLVTIKGTAKFSKFIGIINSISSDMAINFKVLLSVDNNRNILSFNNYITFRHLSETSISETTDEEFDILRLELEYLGITIEEIEGLFDIKVTG